MAKGNNVELKTFKSYGVDEILGFKTEEKDGQTYVNFIWCKVCARNEEGIKKHPNLRGNTKMSAMAFIKGTNVETNDNDDDNDEFKTDDEPDFVDADEPNSDESEDE